MKRINAAALVIVAALLVIAAFAAASASAATVICASEKSPCPTSEIKPSGSYLSTSVNHTVETSTKFNLTGFAVTFSCNAATLKSKGSAEVGNPLTAGAENSLNLESCKNAGETCSKATISNVSETIESTGGNSGVIKVGTASQPLTVSFTCNPKFITECSYAASGPVNYEVAGGTGTIKEASMKIVGTRGAACDETVKLNVVSHVSEGRVSSHKFTVLCKSGEVPCPNGSVEPKGSWLTGGVNTEYHTESAPATSFVLKGATSTYAECGVVFLNSVSIGERGDLKLSAETANLVNAEKCHLFQFGPSEPCTAASASNPAETIESTGGNSGTISIGSEAQPLAITLACGTFIPSECTYSASGPVTYQVTAGERSINGSIKEVTLKRTGSFKGACESSVQLNATTNIISESMISYI